MKKKRNSADIGRATEQSGENIQHFMSNSPWSAQAVYGQVQDEIAATPELRNGGILLLDESADAKAGTKTAGAARQYNGRLGKVDLCQVGVFLSFVKGDVWTWVDGELFLPEHWFAPEMEEERQRLGIPPQLASVWSIPADGGSAALVASITAAPHSPFAFAPDLNKLAFLQSPASAEPPATDRSWLVIQYLDSGETFTDLQAYDIHGWADDAQHFAFLANPQLPQAFIGQVGGQVRPVHTDAETAVIQVRWVDAARYLYLANGDRGWDILLGVAAGTSTLVAAVQGSPPSVDFAH